MLNSHGPGRQHDQAAEGRRPTPPTYAIDFINLEQVSPRRPTRTRRATRCRPASPTRTCRTRWTRPGRTPTSLGVYLPAGQLPDRAASSRCTARPIKVVGAGTVVHPVRRAARPGEHRRRLPAPRRRPTGRRSSTSPTSATTRPASTGRARCSTSRNVANMTIDNIWVEHTVCACTGASNIRRHDHQEHPDPQHVRRRHQHDQRQHQQPGHQQRGPGHRRRQRSRCSRRSTPAAATTPATSSRTCPPR